MIKIDEIKIKGYKNIESAELKLGNFNVIIGPNNSGKSNFIQIISFLNYVINSSLDDVEKSFLNGFFSSVFKRIAPINEDFFTESKKIPISFELTYSNSSTDRIFKYFLELEGNTSIFDVEYKIKSEKLDVKESKKPGKLINVFTRLDDYVKYGIDFSKMDVIKRVGPFFSVIRVLKILQNVKEDYKDAFVSLNEIIRTPIFYFSYIELLKTDKDRINAFNGRIVSFELEEEIINLEDGNKWEIFKEAIKNILNIDKAIIYKFPGDPKEKIPETKQLYFKHQNVFKNLTQFSDGTVILIAFITKLLSSNSQLFLIEEPENSIHPKALIDLISFIKSFSESKQFIITSHSIPLINKTKIEEIIVSTIKENGLCEFFNVYDKKDLRNRLKKSRTSFSDELFFTAEDTKEFE